MSAPSSPDIFTSLAEHGYTQPTFSSAGAVFTADHVLMSAGRLNTPYELASVTKLMTTWAVLRACDTGALSLDAPLAEGYTLRHLLSHSSGAPRERGGKNLAPQTRRLYSNWGMERAAMQVETAVHMPFKQWVEEQILSPLGMTNTDFYGSPAHGARSTLTDIMALGRELLHPTLLSDETARQAHTIQFPELSGRVPGYRTFDPNPWGLGMEIRGNKVHWLSEQQSPRTVGHFGQAGSYLWIDPDVEAGAVFLGSEPFGPWHQENWVKLNSAIGEYLRAKQA